MIAKTNKVINILKHIPIPNHLYTALRGWMRKLECLIRVVVLRDAKMSPAQWRISPEALCRPPGVAVRWKYGFLQAFVTKSGFKCKVAHRAERSTKRETERSIPPAPPRSFFIATWASSTKVSNCGGNFYDDIVARLIQAPLTDFF